LVGTVLGLPDEPLRQLSLDVMSLSISGRHRRHESPDPTGQRFAFPGSVRFIP
jgi:hypothetical protein